MAELRKALPGLAVERRAFSLTEVRVSEQGGAPKIAGYAAVFNQLSEPLGNFREIIRPGAFKNTLNADIRALWNHDSNYVLGRTKSGTVKLAEDDHGLAVEINPPDTSWGRDLVESLRRKDVDQMSFGFRVVEDRWISENNQTLRELLDVMLFDVSIVTYPAYPQTSVAVRSADEVYQEHLAQTQASEGRNEPDNLQAQLSIRRKRLELLERI